MTVQGKTITVPTGSSAAAAIDTGTTLIGGPTSTVQAIYNAIPDSESVPNSGGMFAFRKCLSKNLFIALTSHI
jgi:cathepsin D